MYEYLCVNASAQEGQHRVTYGQGSGGERVRLQKSCDSSPYLLSSEGVFLLKALTQALRIQGM